MIKTSEDIILDLRFKILAVLSIYDKVSSSDVILLQEATTEQLIAMVTVLSSLSMLDPADHFIIDNILGDEPLSFDNACLCRRILIKQPRGDSYNE